MIKIKKERRNPYPTSNKVYALGQHIHMSAHKARRIIDQIRGRSYEETLMILELLPYRACYPIFKLVYSAAANARHNRGFNEASLFISEAAVNEGTTLKRLKPRARGRSFRIKRPTCHITIVLKDIEFVPIDRFATSPGSEGLWGKIRSGGLWGKK
uniref:ribosomal protein L22 n=1 Tax=Helicteres hirsuta TaxID=1489665 RepID=UPI002E7991EF|nr:ribosomal protein L22 [Helicteres hirsuta]WPV76354.1 ribosomal protein L22 [Helicteres hirsuta]